MTAANGKEALEVYRENQSDIGLVILDLIMPSIHTYGAKKTWTYFVGGQDADFLRLTPWVDFGPTSIEVPR